MSETPKRRWFQFSLGGMLIAVAILAAVLAYHVRWKNERQAFIVEQRALIEAWLLHTENVWYPNDCRAPGLLPLIGEQGHSQVHIWVGSRNVDDLPTADRVTVRRAHRLFPEAAPLVAFNADGATSWSCPLSEAK